MPKFDESKLRCPVCTSVMITNHDHGQDIDDAKIELAAANTYEGDDLEIYDCHIEMCKCHNGHMFYLSVPDDLA